MPPPAVCVSKIVLADTELNYELNYLFRQGGETMASGVGDSGEEGLHINDEELMQELERATEEATSRPWVVNLYSIRHTLAN